jgi:hypothetical protein
MTPVAYHVIIPKAVSRAVGRCGLSRTGLLRLLNNLHTELAGGADEFRSAGVPEDPDVFTYAFRVFDQGVWHACDFSVNDTIVPGTPFVVSLTHRTYPA